MIPGVAQPPGEVVVVAGSRKVNTRGDSFSSLSSFPVPLPRSGRQLHHLKFKILVKGVISCNYTDELHLAGPFKEGSRMDPLFIVWPLLDEPGSLRTLKGRPWFYDFCASFTDLYRAFQIPVALVELRRPSET